MRYFLCETCGSKAHPKGAGIRQLFAASQFEPAEFARITWGVARHPTVQQRTISVNGVPQQMDLSYYNCDLCNAQIFPGDRCLTQTVWREGDQVPGNWEADYLENVNA
jgi:hypothetical protein